MPNYQIFYKLYEILPLWNFLWHRLAMAATGPVVNIDAQLASEAHMKCEIELNQLRPSGLLTCESLYIPKETHDIRHQSGRSRNLSRF